MFGGHDEADEIYTKTKEKSANIHKCDCSYTEVGGHCNQAFWDSGFEGGWCMNIVPMSGGKYCGHKASCHAVQG